MTGRPRAGWTRRRSSCSEQGRAQGWPGVQNAALGARHISRASPGLLQAASTASRSDCSYIYLAYSPALVCCILRCSKVMCERSEALQEAERVRWGPAIGRRPEQLPATRAWLSGLAAWRAV